MKGTSCGVEHEKNKRHCDIKFLFISLLYLNAVIFKKIQNVIWGQWSILSLFSLDLKEDILFWSMKISNSISFWCEYILNVFYPSMNSCIDYLFQYSGSLLDPSITALQYCAVLAPLFQMPQAIISLTRCSFLLLWADQLCFWLLPAHSPLPEPCLSVRHCFWSIVLWESK